ncbi:F-box/LRR-repeat protein At4g14103-like [Papaver somniferum]|uniref:F-box/LRR-repeat protein At4g14103-like n=1 Tax=Papaver somniferum TaxID=3469 RepID=UPI000E7003E2|nr:F-box/LRR-repeat protein At4g14103-like [Papaver somniferum]
MGEDRISILPIDLLHHILLLVPAKCVMSTCILSKRWKYVSNSIPTLDLRKWKTQKPFSEEGKMETKSFKKFLDTVLFLHEKPSIKKLYLDLDEDFDESQVSRWISNIIKRKVEEFYLHMIYSRIFCTIPLSFFTCDSLTLLDLRCNEDGVGKFIIPKNPNTVYFPKLKILQLQSLQFLDEITSTRKFFSNCPILEELSLTDCEMSERLCIANPTLKHLVITHCRLLESTVEIYAPNLLTISYIAEPAEDYLLSIFPSLVEANIKIDTEDFSQYDHPIEVFVKIFENLSSAKLLRICADSFMYGTFVVSVSDIQFNDSLTFSNLIHLEVDYLLHYDRFDSPNLIRTFFKFLQRLPTLESILFPQSVKITCVEDDDCWSLDPRRSPPHLKVIKFKKFEGQSMELNVIKLFLKYVRFLESVTIVDSLRLSEDHLEQNSVMK